MWVLLRGGEKAKKKEGGKESRGRKYGEKKVNLHSTECERGKIGKWALCHEGGMVWK